MLFVFLAALVPIVSGVAGLLLAPSRGRPRLKWFIVCFLLPLVGPVLLRLLPAEADEPEPLKASPAPAVATTAQKLPPPIVRTEAAPAALVDGIMASLPAMSPSERWHYLVEYDPDLRDAAAALKPLGPVAGDKLRDAFFALQDRSMVPGIVARIRQQHAPPPPAERRDDFLTQLGLLAAQANPPLQTLTQTKRTTAEPPLKTLVESMPATAALLVPRHTTVTPQDLDTAIYRETHRGVHLYQLTDGRIYIDGQLALASLDAARNRINQSLRQSGPQARENAGMAMHS